MKSRYDDLHEYYYSLLSTKAGTGYERLAAAVFKRLHESGTIIHDLKLLGDSGTAHRIDVSIEGRRGLERILIECKHLDVGDDKVDQEIAQNFFAVVEDVRPEIAYIVTCSGFTADARRYAKAKGINLAMLLKVSSADVVGRIMKVISDLRLISTASHHVKLSMGEAEQAKLKADMMAAGVQGGGLARHDPVFINTPSGRLQLLEFVSRHVSASAREDPGRVVREADLVGHTIEVETRGAIPLRALHLSYGVVASEDLITVAGDRIAKLILERPQGKDLILWDDELGCFQFDSGDAV